MKLQLLGTGDASGWPVPWCDCSSCTTLRARGELRANTAALLDGVLLLDCGPDLPRSAERHGAELTAVRHVLVSHAHDDHWAPQTLAARGYAGLGSPMALVGPPAVVATAPAPAWLSTKAVSPGDRLAVGPYDVRVLAARHGDAAVGPAVLYDVTGSDGARLLWATDTAPLPPATLDAVEAAGYDAVLLEETWGDVAWERTGTDHHDLAAFAATVGELRRRGAVVDRTRVIAIHLGHRNPPDVTRRLADIGAEVLPDGARVLLGGVGGPRRVLVLGGARSGKSAYAELLLAGEREVTYVATGPAVDAGDGEWAQRVRDHRDRRPSSWHTVETVDIVPLLARPSPLLVDSLSLWLTAALSDTGSFDEAPPAAAPAALAARVDALVAAWADAAAVVVAVSDEVGLGVHPSSRPGRVFRDELGRLNARLAAAADEVWLVTAGIPQRLK